MASGQFAEYDMYDDDIEGSMEADNTDLSRDRSKEGTNGGYTLHGHKESQGRKVRGGKKEIKHLDYIREGSSGTEGQNLGTLRRNFDVKVADAKLSRSSQSYKIRSKEDRTERGIVSYFQFQFSKYTSFIFCYQSGSPFPFLLFVVTQTYRKSGTLIMF